MKRATSSATPSKGSPARIENTSRISRRQSRPAMKKGARPIAASGDHSGIVAANSGAMRARVGDLQ